MSFNTASGKYYCNLLPSPRSFATISGFNTASGKYYCNHMVLVYQMVCISLVSIPQAVSTIAIKNIADNCIMVTGTVSIPQAVSTIAIFFVISTHCSYLQFQYRKR